MAARHAFPASSTALVLLVLAAPFGLPAQAELQPAFARATVFFWSLFRPRAVPAPAVFALGLLLDLLESAPLGTGVLILLLVHGIALRSRRLLTRQDFAAVWAAFAAVCGVAASAEWALTSLLTWRVLPAAPALIEAALGTGFYPFAAVLLTRAHRGAAAPERA